MSCNLPTLPHGLMAEAALLRTGAPDPSRPRPQDCRDMPFLIRRDGEWLYRGSPIRRKELVCLFASVLTRDEHGAFLLETPAERGRIEVEDAPFTAVELDWGICPEHAATEGGGQHLSFRLNTDQVVCACPDHPIRVADSPAGDRIPYLFVRPGKGAFPVEARICRAVYYELVALAEPRLVDGQDCLGVWSGGSFFPLGERPDEA